MPDDLPWLLSLFLRMPVTALALAASLLFLAVRAARPGAPEPSRRVLGLGRELSGFGRETRRAS